MVDNKQIRSCLVELNFMEKDDRISAQESLFDRGVIDSLGIMSLTSFLINRYGIVVHEKDLLPDNFDSIASIARYVNGKLGSANRNLG